MIINGQTLLTAAPIVDMLSTKERLHGVSYGLAEAGYDIRLKQDLHFNFSYDGRPYIFIDSGKPTQQSTKGRFTLASAIEEFQMPNDLVGVVHDKSTWARKGISVFNTVIEPGWNGFLTLEIVYHGYAPLVIPAGSGIAQVLFSKIQNTGAYDGKYQNQSDEPVAARFEHVQGDSSNA